MSPFELMYKVKARLPQQLKEDADKPCEWSSSTRQEPVDEIMERVQSVRDLLITKRGEAHKNITKAQEVQKKNTTISNALQQRSPWAIR